MTRAKEKLILSVCSNTRPQRGSYLEILNALMPLSKIEKDDKFLPFKNYQIPITHFDSIKEPVPIKDSAEENKGEVISATIGAEYDIKSTVLPTEEIDFPDLSINLNNIQIGSIMHRFLQVWNFEKMSIESTINYVLNESYTIDDKMHEQLNTLAENFLDSDLFAQIKSADDIKREIPFYIELDGNNERRKIDLLIFKDGNMSLFDYKLSGEIKEEYIEQMNLYEKALLKKYSCNNISKNLVHVPDVVIKTLN